MKEISHFFWRYYVNVKTDVILIQIYGLLRKLQMVNKNSTIKGKNNLRSILSVLRIIYKNIDCAIDFLIFSDIVGLENLQDQCLAQLKLRTLKGFNGMKLTVDLETEIVNGREFTRYMMPTGRVHIS